ncbi:mitochondrial ribonuclease P catalytic subunit-like [Bradysia coprophila]|uniref:mitochondrial ribonuclease P catalytic subunit-like n=1 Tax=Bradysia coprophila TaxID=38358 RepID=UPI00187DC5B7|nr:mitochondrial ribonuclease P catalytic subunit-like [Bradysia coprophila]XP_037040470.1 mitochondrial ribonuclease P catalytic subunit-like [Bradysia coprophila]
MLRFHTLTGRVLEQKRKSTINAMRDEKLFRLHNLIRQTLDQARRPTINEWHELREKLLLNWPRNGQHKSVIDKLVVDNCFPDKLDSGKSYVDYLKASKQKLPKSIWISALGLYYNASKCGIRMTANHQRDIIEMCQYLHGTHTHFCPNLGVAIIRGLVLTADWRKSLDIIDSLRTSSQLQTVYSAIVQRAIQEQDEHLVWEMFDKIAAKRICLHDEVLTLYIGQCERNASTFKENIDRMLAAIGANRILVTAEVANEFQRAFRRFNYSCTVTTVSERGECHSCGKHLRGGVKLTDDEFDSLRSHFWHNISAKSTPKEMDSFKPFIDGTRTYDIVIDGLNVRTTRCRPVEPEAASVYEIHLSQLTNVVKYFADRKKKVLVIGREHMNEWSKTQMDYIGEHADLFLAENSSEDDEFLIYSALKSGPNTNIVTRDALQNHAHKLDEKLRTVFRRWQQQHQYSVKLGDDPRIVEFDERIEFDMNAQQTDDGCWHIPFVNGPRFTFQDNNFFKLWKNWVCVSMK